MARADNQPIEARLQVAAVIEQTGGAQFVRCFAKWGPDSKPVNALLGAKTAMVRIDLAIDLGSPHWGKLKAGDTVDLVLRKAT